MLQNTITPLDFREGLLLCKKYKFFVKKVQVLVEICKPMCYNDSNINKQQEVVGKCYAHVLCLRRDSVVSPL